MARKTNRGHISFSAVCSLWKTNWSQPRFSIAVIYFGCIFIICWRRGWFLDYWIDAWKMCAWSFVTPLLNSCFSWLYIVKLIRWLSAHSVLWVVVGYAPYHRTQAAQLMADLMFLTSDYLITRHCFSFFIIESVDWRCLLISSSPWSVWWAIHQVDLLTDDGLSFAFFPNFPVSFDVTKKYDHRWRLNLNSL